MQNQMSGEILLEIVGFVVVYFVGIMIMAAILRISKGKDLTYKLFIWLTPGIMFSVILSRYALQLRELIGLIFIPFIFVGSILVMSLNFIIVGKYLIGKIQIITSTLSESAEEVHAAADALSCAGQSLAETVTSQAVAIEETSSAVLNMSTTAEGNARNVDQARTLMRSARDRISNLNDHIIDMSTTMKAVTQKSEETVHLIKIIDDIAFQTNMLAINAAVVAARAGEAGSGFAVIADEVRNLASRSACAAATTGKLIHGTINMVHESNAKNSQTQKAFEESVQIIQSIDNLIAKISSSTKEHTLEISKIKTAVIEIENDIQRNAASAEESASAAEEMSAQTLTMKGAVESLKTILGINNTEVVVEQKELEYEIQEKIGIENNCCFQWASEGSSRNIHSGRSYNK